MICRKFDLVPIALACVAVGALSLSFFYSYKTGCTADLKTGVLGNIPLALHYGGIGQVWVLIGIVSGTASIATIHRLEAASRHGIAAMFFFFGSFLILLVAMQIETWGIQQCFAP